jgi:lipopolysaccharide export LptBFGC system permease protein LptF
MIGRRLDRHVLRSFLGPYCASLAGLAVLMVIFDLFERVDECFELVASGGSGAGGALKVIAVYYAGRVLAFLAGYGGLACLAGAALAVAVLHRNGEVTAMRAAGVSVRRAFMPLLIFAALAGGVQLAAAEYCVRPLAPAADQAMDVICSRRSPRGRNVSVSRRARLAVWRPGGLRGADQPIWKGKAQVNLIAGRVSRGGRQMDALTIEVVLDAPEGPEAPPAYRMSAERALWTRRGWVLTDGKFYRYWGPEPIAACELLSCDITPTRLEARALGLAGVGLGDLVELRNDQSARVELWQRLGLPLTNVVLLLIGLPLAVLGSARGGRLLPLGMALVLGALYMLAAELGAHLARGSELLDHLESARGGDWLKAMGGPLRLAVDAAMGLPHLIFLAAGSVLYWRVER